MKKVLIFLLVVSFCISSYAFAEGKQTACSFFALENGQATVKIDLGYSWSVDFGPLVVYVYDGADDGCVEPLFSGYFVGVDEYERLVSEESESASDYFEQTENMVWCVRSGLNELVFFIGHDVYYRLSSIDLNLNLKDLMSRFEISYISNECCSE